MKFPNSGALDNPNLIVVNQQHPIQEELKFERFLIGKETINTSIVDSLSRLFSEAEKNGFRFTLVSGSRLRIKKAYLINLSSVTTMPVIHWNRRKT